MSDMNTRNGSDARSNTALLVVDMISDFDFKDGEKLYRNVRPIVENIANLRRKASRNGVPVIFVNDNFGRWQTAFPNYVAKLRSTSPHAVEILDEIEPKDDDYYIVKPQRSGFYATGLSVLLMSMNITNVIVTGVTTDICVLFTAHDAYMRGYKVTVPADCCAAVEREFHTAALSYLRRVAEADTSAHHTITFSKNNDIADDSIHTTDDFRYGAQALGA